MTTSDKRVDRLEVIFMAAVLICLLSLCLYRLEIYPAPWFDEGLPLQAAKNVAREGQYGLRSPEGFALFHPAIQTGPTVLLPVALVLRLAGTGILQVRLVAVLYAVLALVVFYWLVRETISRKAALLASLLLLFTFDHEFTSFVFMGRQVLGEVPALAFFWLGSLLWFRAWKSPRWTAFIWPGVLWGLAMLTKVQFALILPSSLVLFWLFDRIFYKKLQAYQVLIPLAIGGFCVFVWYGYQVLTMDFAGFWQQTVELESAGGIHFFYFSPQRMASAIFQLLGSTLFLFGVPGMLYALGVSLKHRGDASESQQVFLVVFTAVWLGWYALLSVGWMRYAFVPTAMSMIFSARMIGDLWDWSGRGRQRLSRRLPLAAGRLAVGGVTVMLLLSGLAPMIKQIAQSPDSGLQELAQYLNMHIPTDVVIESWEWEVDMLTDHTFHHPSYGVTNAVTAQIWYGTSVPSDLYDPLDFDPVYLLRGPFAKWTNIYSQDLLEQRSVLITSIGDYDLYKVNREKE